MKLYNKIEKIKYNISFGILRIYLSFVVVNTHCFNASTFIIQNRYILLLLINQMHVPIFYIMSFYLCFNLFAKKNIMKIKLRFQRLIIPYIIWPFIFFYLINYIISYLKLI